MRFLLLALLTGCASTKSPPRVIPGEDPHARAGYPKEVSAHAGPSDDGGYVGYEVGGGAPFGHGDGPTPDDGTWGWDYVGCHWPAWVELGWWRGKEQGGQGAYKTDGPRRKHE